MTLRAGFSGGAGWRATNVSQSRSPSGFSQAVGWLLLLVSVSVFASRLQHAGPYAPPEGGNLFAGVLALVLGVSLAGGWLGAALRWIALLASPVVLFFALYATLAELEEVVVLKAATRSGQPADLRLWIVDRGDAAWVTMPRSKADAHGLSETRAELLRQGVVSCVIVTRDEDRATVNEIHQLRHQKYAVQRIATTLGIFGRSAGEDVVALRLEPCSEG